MNERLKKLLQSARDRMKSNINTFGNEGKELTMEDIMYMSMPMGSVGKGAKSGKEAIKILKEMMSKNNKKTPIDPTRIQRWLFEKNMQRTNAPQQFANKKAHEKAYKEASGRLQNKNIQDRIDWQVGNPKGSWNNPGPLDRLKTDEEKIMYIMKNLMGGAPVAGLTQTLKDSSNVETENKRELPYPGIRGSGYWGKNEEGERRTFEELTGGLFENETAEQDSVQQDALRRLKGSGLWGKRGNPFKNNNIDKILEAILKKPRP